MKLVNGEKVRGTKGKVQDRLRAMRVCAEPAAGSPQEVSKGALGRQPSLPDCPAHGPCALEWTVLHSNRAVKTQNALLIVFQIICKNSLRAKVRLDSLDLTNSSYLKKGSRASKGVGHVMCSAIFAKLPSPSTSAHGISHWMTGAADVTNKAFNCVWKLIKCYWK